MDRTGCCPRECRVTMNWRVRSSCTLLAILSLTVAVASPSNAAAPNKYGVTSGDNGVPADASVTTDQAVGGYARLCHPSPDAQQRKWRWRCNRRNGRRRGLLSRMQVGDLSCLQFEQPRRPGQRHVHERFEFVSSRPDTNAGHVHGARGYVLDRPAVDLLCREHRTAGWAGATTRHHRRGPQLPGVPAVAGAEPELSAGQWHPGQPAHDLRRWLPPGATGRLRPRRPAHHRDAQAAALDLDV